MCINLCMVVDKRIYACMCACRSQRLPQVLCPTLFTSPLKQSLSLHQPGHPLGLPSNHCWDDSWLAYTIELRSSQLPTLFHLSHFPSLILSSHITQLSHFTVFIQSQHITEILVHPCQLQPCSQQRKSGTNLRAHQQEDGWRKCSVHTQWDFPVIKKNEVMSFAERWAK